VIALEGIVTSGVGEGAFFLSLPWVRRAIGQAVGFDPYPGTLNIRLGSAEIVARWREIRTSSALLLQPPSREQCGGRLVPIVVAPDVPAAVVIPDVTRYGDDVLEVVAAVHLRTRLGLRDGERVRFGCPDVAGGRS
jgi:riboflavin kinase, archaea type